MRMKMKGKRMKMKAGKLGKGFPGGKGKKVADPSKTGRKVKNSSGAKATMGPRGYF